DQQLTDLPLADILAQLRPDSLARRTDQVVVSVAEDLPDLFGARGERLAPVRVMDKKEAAASAAAASANTAFTRQNPPTARNVLPVAPKSVQEPPPTAMPQPRGAVPQAPSQPRAVPFRPNTTPPATPTPVPRPTSPVPASIPRPTAPSSAAAKPLPKPGPQKPATPAAPGLPTRPIPAPAPSQTRADLFQIPVDVVAQGWPEEIRQELARVKAPDLRLAIPAAEVCEGLKRRAVQFPWRMLRHWLQPQPPSGASPHDEVVLVLPLDTITPLFLDHIRSSPTHRKAADPHTVTEFFRRAETASPSVAAPIPPMSPQVPQRAAAPAPQKATAPAPQRAAAPVHQRAASTPAPAPIPFAPAPDPAAAAGVDGVLIPLGQFSSGWTDVIKRDIAQFNLGESSVSIPLEY